jgi:hypothetical protein
MGVLSILLLVGTALAPMWMLALGPIVLGVPHLLADLRYCVAGQRGIGSPQCGSAWEPRCCSSP